MYARLTTHLHKHNAHSEQTIFKEQHDNYQQSHIYCSGGKGTLCRPQHCSVFMPVRNSVTTMPKKPIIASLLWVWWWWLGRERVVAEMAR